MNELVTYTLNKIGRKLQSANLDNWKGFCSHEESEDNMSKKIRREVEVRGMKVWVTADTEQEYVNKLLNLAGSTNRNSEEKHSF